MKDYIPRDKPLEAAIIAALWAARHSPCAKSKRGACIFSPEEEKVRVFSYNSPPENFSCLENDECRRACAKICSHAETRAITAFLRTHFHDGSRHHLVHVKITKEKKDYKHIEELLAAGGPPSCVECSKQVLESDIEGVWLYEARQEGPIWVYYQALDFHTTSLINNRLPHKYCAKEEKDK